MMLSGVIEWSTFREILVDIRDHYTALSSHISWGSLKLGAVLKMKQLKIWCSLYLKVRTRTWTQACQWSNDISTFTLLLLVNDICEWAMINSILDWWSFCLPRPDLLQFITTLISALVTPTPRTIILKYPRVTLIPAESIIEIFHLSDSKAFWPISQARRGKCFQSHEIRQKRPPELFIGNVHMIIGSQWLGLVFASLIINNLSLAL